MCATGNTVQTVDLHLVFFIIKYHLVFECVVNCAVVSFLYSKSFYTERLATNEHINNDGIKSVTDIMLVYLY